MRRRAVVCPVWGALAVALIGCGGGEPGTVPSDARRDEPASRGDASTEVAPEEAATDASGDASTEVAPEEAATDAWGGDQTIPDALPCHGDSGLVTFQGCRLCPGGLPNVKVSPGHYLWVDYVCSATAQAELVRIKVCVWDFDNPATVDDELTYCAV